MNGLAIILAFALTSAAEVTEIRLERTPCYGTCPVDEVVLRPDGTATYIGKRFVKRIGRYRGTFPRDDFDRLVELLEANDFTGLNDRYSRPVTDHPSLITSVTRGGQTKRVVNYANAGPDGLRAIEKAILGLAEDIEWQEDE